MLLGAPGLTITGSSLDTPPPPVIRKKEGLQRQGPKQRKLHKNKEKYVFPRFSLVFLSFSLVFLCFSFDFFKGRISKKYLQNIL